MICDQQFIVIREDGVFQKDCEEPASFTAQKMNFSIKISSANVTIFVHIY